MTAPSTAAARRTWFVIWGAITVAPLVYGVIAPMVARNVVPGPDLVSMRTAFLAAAAASVAFGFLLMRTAARASETGGSVLATRDDGQPATPAAFQLRSIIAMAMFESVAIYGFVLLFLGAPPLEYWPWGIVSFALQVAIVLPAARSYWSELERTAGGTGAIG